MLHFWGFLFCGRVRFALLLYHNSSDDRSDSIAFRQAFIRFFRFLSLFCFFSRLRSTSAWFARQNWRRRLLRWFWGFYSSDFGLFDLGFRSCHCGYLSRLEFWFFLGLRRAFTRYLLTGSITVLFRLRLFFIYSSNSLAARFLELCKIISWLAYRFFCRACWSRFRFFHSLVINLTLL